jgi:quinol monooxygenase YgiN
MYRSLYFLCSIAITALGFAQAARAEEASDATVYVVAYIEVMPPSTGEAITLLRQYREASRKEAGNARLEVLQQHGRPDHFVLVEVWRDQSAFEAHGKTMHATQWRNKPGDWGYASSRYCRRYIRGDPCRRYSTGQG